MHARDEEAGDREQADHLVADECEIEVAGPGTIGVERRAVLPSITGDGAAAQDHSRAGRNFLTDDAEKILEAFFAAAEREPHDVGALLRLRHRLFFPVLPV